MTDENDPKPMKKTSAVPLRKETVRVTLKATPDSGAGSDSPPAPAPTIPLNKPGTGAPSVPAPAPTVKLQTGAPTPTLRPQTATKTPEPAPTVKLDTPGTSSPTGSSSQPLPKATVQLDQSQPMGAPTELAGTPSQAPTIVAVDDAAARKEEGSAAVLSVVALVAALILLGVQLGTTNIWVNDETQENPGWGRLFE